ncbi:MAG: PaaI family thioesterase [Actinomycetota bacterium]
MEPTGSPTALMEVVAFQDQIPDNFCYGCGPSNPVGLKLKSYWDGEEAVSTFEPSSHQAAGPRQFLNGGVIATLIDCHCVCTAVANAYRLEDRPIGSEPHIWCVTAALNVTYLRPTPIDKPVMLRVRILETTAKKTVLECSLHSGFDECARGEVVTVRVPESWRVG